MRENIGELPSPKLPTLSKGHSNVPLTLPEPVVSSSSPGLVATAEQPCIIDLFTHELNSSRLGSQVSMVCWVKGFLPQE